MSRGHIFRPEEMPPVDRGKGIRSIPMAGATTGAKGCSNGFTMIGPGSGVPLHTHNVEEIVVVIEGEGVCHIDGEEQKVGPLHTTLVPAGVPHFFKNTTQGVLKILWTYASTQVSRTFVETGETVEHLSPKDRIGG